MFSVGSDSLLGVCVLVLVVNSGQDEVSAAAVQERLDELEAVSVRKGETGEILRALERQGFVEQSGVRFCATEMGEQRVEEVLRGFDSLREESLSEGASVRVLG